MTVLFWKRKCMLGPYLWPWVCKYQMCLKIMFELWKGRLRRIPMECTLMHTKPNWIGTFSDTWLSMYVDNRHVPGNVQHSCPLHAIAYTFHVDTLFINSINNSPLTIQHCTILKECYFSSGLKMNHIMILNDCAFVLELCVDANSLFLTSATVRMTRTRPYCIINVTPPGPKKPDTLHLL
jgi:hypothetical protein